MELKKIISKSNKLDKLKLELSSIDLSQYIGQKVKMTTRSIKWYKDNGDFIGMPISEMDMIKSRPIGVIVKGSHSCDNGITFQVDFGELKLYLDIKDLKVV